MAQLYRKYFLPHMRYSKLFDILHPVAVLPFSGKPSGTTEAFADLTLPKEVGSPIPGS